jgi:hypothetical protein
MLYLDSLLRMGILTAVLGTSASQRHPNKSVTMSAFETAVADSKKLTSKPSNDELLKLYGMHTACGNMVVLSDGI